MTHQINTRHPRSPVFWQGFRTVMPFWLAAAPLAVAYVASAQAAGLTPMEIQAMSLIIYSAPTQLGIVQMWSAGTPVVTVLLMILMLNAHQILYGLSLARQMRLSHRQRVLGAYFLTDAAYAVTIAAGENAGFSFLFGAEVSLYLVWNGFTGLGIWLGQQLAFPPALPLRFVVPLTIWVLLVSSIKNWIDVGVVLVSTVAALLCLWLGLGSSSILLVALVGASLGVWIENCWLTTSGTDRP